MSTPESAADYVPAPDVQAWLLMAGLVAIALTPVVSLMVLARFRRIVSWRMSLGAPMPTAHRRRTGWRPLPVAPPVAPLPGALLPPPGLPPGRPGTLAGVVRGRRRLTLAWYTVAALLYGSVGAVSLLVGTHSFDSLAAVALALVYAWPWVPTTALVLGLTRRRAALLVVGYLLVLVAVSSTGYYGLQGGALGPVLWALFAGPATVFMAAVAAPRWRAAGPHLALVVFLVSAGLLIWPWIALGLMNTGATLRVSRVLGVVVPLVVVPLALTSLAWTVRRYGRKRTSEQSLLIDQWWLIFTLFQCLMQLGNPTVWPGLLAAYGVYLGVAGVGRRHLGRVAAARPGPRLLLLRVFDRGRGERLLRDVSSSWRYVGSVHLIAGWDLATATMGPDEFLDFTLGRFARHFVTGPHDLSARISQLDVVPDGDGRYRVNDFFCYRDTWQQSVQALAERVDVVLVDLRGLTSRNEGVTYELQYLVQSRILHRVVALVDGTTDGDHLHRVLEGTARGASLWLRTIRVDDGLDAMSLLDRIEATAVPAALVP